MNERDVDDRGVRILAQLVERPIIRRHANDRDAEQPSSLEPVQGVEGHLLRRSPVIPKIPSTSAGGGALVELNTHRVSWRLADRVGEGPGRDPGHDPRTSSASTTASLCWVSRAL
jgi:hypothetical protein